MRAALAVSVVALAACHGAARAPEPFEGAMPPYHDGARLAVVGDLQRTSPVLEAWREQNDAERSLIVRAIAESHPDLLAITGDCVFDGGSDAQWRAFDALTAPLHSARIPTLAAFGNHEYWAGREAAERHVYERFPLDHERHWFAVALGALRLVVLDANEDRLTKEEWRAELEWYERTLAAFDRDAEVRGVLVLLHQPPFTNSTVTGDEPQVQRDFVPPLLGTKKTLAMLSGHVHNYERFTRLGKMFVVSGGGGGPRAELATGAARRHPDDLVVGPPLRDFHFTLYTVDATGVTAEVRGVAKGETRVKTLDRFALPWPT